MRVAALAPEYQHELAEVIGQPDDGERQAWGIIPKLSPAWPVGVHPVRRPVQRFTLVFEYRFLY